MRESNIPKILKTIYLQIDDEDDISTFDKKHLKKNNNNILNVNDYIEDVKKSVDILSSTKNEQSISSFMKYILI